MRPFKHTNAKTLDEVVTALLGDDTQLIAGGTDLLGTLKDNILPDHPAQVMNLKSVPDLDYIREEDGTLKIGACTRLADIADNEIIATKYTALAQAAKSVATPHIRNMATIAGNLAQLPRCWYFRKPENRFPCIRKGGSECFAITGENRFHSLMGGVKVKSTACSSGCPAGTDIPGYLALIRDGKWDAAARKIMTVNPMPSITSRVCAHFCQDGCNRGNVDESVLVGGVERALGDYIFENPDKFYVAPDSETGKSVAIVGSGPSGLSAAYFLRLAGNQVTVYDSKPEAGGMLMYAIPAYRLPKDLVRELIGNLESMGIVFKTGTTVGVAVSPDELERNYDSVLYATGAWKRPVVGIAGEELTVFGLDFLVEVHQWMEGKMGSEVIVTGGGNVAMDVAITAKRLGANKVTLACLEPRERMPASDEEIARAEEEGIVIMPSWGLDAVVEENGVVKGMRLKRCVSPWDHNGVFNPEYDENDTTVINGENILMAVGQQVDLSFLDEKYQARLNRRGLIDVSEETRMTSRKGIFASGDVTTGPATVIGSIANGHQAAEGMNRYVGVNSPRYDEPGERYLKFDLEGIKNRSALKLTELDADNRALDLEDSLSPSMEQAAKEATRCMNCGCYAVHPSDIAPALIALDAEIVTNRRTLDAENLFAVRQESNTVLSRDEIITEIRIPTPLAGAKSQFMKMSFRKSIDFPVVNCAVMVGGSEPRICLNAVAPKPFRAIKAEVALNGQTLTEEVAEMAGLAAVEDAKPFEDSRYKAQIAKTLVKRALLSTLES